MKKTDIFGAVSRLQGNGNTLEFYNLQALDKAGLGNISRLPFTIKILLESALRNFDGFSITDEHVRILAGWQPGSAETTRPEIPFMPARVLLQDFTGVPALVDMAALRSAMQAAGKDPGRINPKIDVDLVIDHSVQVDAFGSTDAADINTKLEFKRNHERYTFMRWGQKAFRNFRALPPGSGIVHQVNLEYLAKGVQKKQVNGTLTAFPDSLVGTDSHTTMINGLGVLGWGVGGIEAEAVMLGQPIYMTLPEVVGVELNGVLPPGATATDLVLLVTEILREHGVVGKFVEFYGNGLDSLSLPDRATIANMAPEYGATAGFFPVDDETIRYLLATGRSSEEADLVERYSKEQGLFRCAERPSYSQTLLINLESVEPSIAGPRRPQDRISIKEAGKSFQAALANLYNKQFIHTDKQGEETESSISHGAVVIASITSCTNTSNPSVLLGAGLLAKKAVERGINVKPWVKTSLAPGSKVVTRYLDESGLLSHLETLGFYVVGYGCATCIGNSGPLPPDVADAIRKNDLVAAAVLSGNRNFEGRVNSLVKANYLASPPLVVAYAIAGTMNIDIVNDPLCHDANGEPVYLRDIWPSDDEVRNAMACVKPEMFQDEYRNIFKGGDLWNIIQQPDSVIYPWNDDSTYIQEPPFFQGLALDTPSLEPITGARVLAVLGDSVTTDHISPAGAIPADSPAGKYLISQGVEPRDFNSYGSRRGNHEVMVRGTFANIRLKNLLAPGTEGGYTTYPPGNDVTTIYEASMQYQAETIPLIVFAGKEYGTGSSRDWAAKGTRLLGVKAVIAESYERIHRSNLVGMGVLPLEFEKGQNRQSLGLTGCESFDINLTENLKPGDKIQVTATFADGETLNFSVTARLDSQVEVSYYRNGGILHTVLRDMMKDN